MSGVQQFQNNGAPFHRVDGSVVLTGEIIEPTPKELRQFAYKLKPVGMRSFSEPLPVVTQPSTPSPRKRFTLAAAAEETPEKKAGWPLSMSTELYLRIAPDGKYAELARTILGRSE
jgi:hypothetical protein